MSPPLASSTTIGKELTLIVAQPIPAKIKTGYITSSCVSEVMKLPIKNADAKMITPAKIVFLLPILQAMLPTGMYETIAAACAIINVKLKSKCNTLVAYTEYLLVMEL